MSQLPRLTIVPSAPELEEVGTPVIDVNSGFVSPIGEQPDLSLYQNPNLPGKYVPEVKMEELDMVIPPREESRGFSGLIDGYIDGYIVQEERIDVEEDITEEMPKEEPPSYDEVLVEEFCQEDSDTPIQMGAILHSIDGETLTLERGGR